jgi:hypothetical protein
MKLDFGLRQPDNPDENQAITTEEDSHPASSMLALL